MKYINFVIIVESVTTSRSDYKLCNIQYRDISAGIFNVLSSLFVSIDNLYSLFYDIIVMVSFSYRIRTVTY